MNVAYKYYNFISTISNRNWGAISRHPVPVPRWTSLKPSGWNLHCFRVQIFHPGGIKQWNLTGVKIFRQIFTGVGIWRSFVTGFVTGDDSIGTLRQDVSRFGFCHFIAIIFCCHRTTKIGPFKIRWSRGNRWNLPKCLQKVITIFWSQKERNGLCS